MRDYSALSGSGNIYLTVSQSLKSVCQDSFNRMAFEQWKLILSLPEFVIRLPGARRRIVPFAEHILARTSPSTLSVTLPQQLWFLDCRRPRWHLSNIHSHFTKIERILLQLDFALWLYGTGKRYPKLPYLALYLFLRPQVFLSAIQLAW